MKSKVSSAQIWKAFIDPFRKLPPFNEIKNRDLQTITILLECQKSKLVREAVTK